MKKVIKKIKQLLYKKDEYDYKGLRLSFSENGNICISSLLWLDPQILPKLQKGSKEFSQFKNRMNQIFYYRSVDEVYNITFIKFPKKLNDEFIEGLIKVFNKMVDLT